MVPAFNSHDADGLVAVMTEDVICEHSALPEPIHGRAEVSAFYANSLWKAFPDLTLELADGPFFHPHAPRISFNWLAAGTHTGPHASGTGEPGRASPRHDAAVADEVVPLTPSPGTGLGRPTLTQSISTGASPNIVQLRIQ